MKNESVYIIGEIGQNHNGSLDIAKLLIDIVARPVFDEFSGESLRSMDAIKLVKRDLSEELSASQMKEVYNSPHSFGYTYGEHRQYLELSDEAHKELYKYAKERNLDFVETICAKGAMSILKYFTPDRIKIASRDVTNIPLLQALAETKIPVIISTGMAGKKELNDALEIFNKVHSNISILHCVSQYPTEYKNVNLLSIPYLIKNYSKYVIGYSDHTIGIATPLAAVAMGAKIIEKHITIDRKMKGNDQAGSLGIEGIERMVRDIRNLELSFGENDIFIDKVTLSTRIKLERSIATNKNLPIGHVLTINDIHLLSPGDGIKWVDRESILGKKICVNIKKDEIIYKKYIEM